MTLNDWIADIERNLEGIVFFSVGACPGCESCYGFSGVDAADPDNPTEDEQDMANESHFSWRSCESCGSGLGGDRHPAHGYLADKSGKATDDLLHLDVCVDCLLFHANGDTPDNLEDEE